MPEYVSGSVNFPLMDSDRANAEHRHVIAEIGYLEPYISETDDWCTMPVRVVVDGAAGVHVELGPYSIDEIDIRLLQNAIRTYYENVNRTRLRVVD